MSLEVKINDAIISFEDFKHGIDPLMIQIQRTLFGESI